MCERREKRVCAWNIEKRRQCSIVFGSREFYFICSCIFCEIFFLSHRVKTFTHLNTTHCCFQCEKWNRQMMRSEWTGERSGGGVHIGILLKQTRRGSFRSTDKKREIRFLEQSHKVFPSFVLTVLGSREGWGKDKRRTSISLFSLWTVLSLSYSIWFS